MNTGYKFGHGTIDAVLFMTTDDVPLAKTVHASTAQRTFASYAGPKSCTHSSGASLYAMVYDIPSE